MLPTDPLKAFVSGHRCNVRIAPDGIGSRKKSNIAFGHVDEKIGKINRTLDRH